MVKYQLCYIVRVAQLQRPTTIIIIQEDTNMSNSIITIKLLTSYIVSYSNKLPNIHNRFPTCSRMKIAIAASVLVLLASVHESGAFSFQPRSNLQAVTKTIHQGRKYNPSSTLLFLSKAQHKDQEQLSNGNSVQQRNQNNENIWRSLARVVRQRSDTLRAAGFYENENSKEFIEPVTAGAKTNITLFLLALGYKWYRSIFINKVR